MAAQQKKPAPQEKPLAVRTPHFTALLVIVTAINLVTLVMGFSLALWGANPATPAQATMLEMCKYAFTTTLGALVGLLCGRAGAPDFSGQLPEQGRG